MARSASIEHVFEQFVDEGAPATGAPFEEDWFDPARLSDTDLIDAVIAFDRVSSWAGARQTALIAEFARRRPGDHPLAARSDVPSRCSEFAPDEIALALHLSRTTAVGRLALAQTLLAHLPETLAAWQAGRSTC